MSTITRFTRGALVPDGRLDLCKQVVGPEGVGPLCAALAQLTTELGLDGSGGGGGGGASVRTLPHASARAPPQDPGAKLPGHSVTRLLLGNNVVGNGGARDIAALIRSGRSTITTW